MASATTLALMLQIEDRLYSLQYRPLSVGQRSLKSKVASKWCEPCCNVSSDTFIKRRERTKLRPKNEISCEGLLYVLPTAIKHSWTPKYASIVAMFSPLRGL